MDMEHPGATLVGELAIVARATAEPAAFADLYDHYFPRIWNYVRYRVESSAIADDITSEVFRRAVDRLRTFDPERAPFAAWLFGIGRNAVTDYHRFRSRRKSVSLEALGDRADASPQPTEIAEANETRQDLLAAIAGLSERERDVLGMKFGARLTNRQVAGATGLSDSNVGVIIYRAVRKLKERFAAKGRFDD
jgi:RNA polymerase sigma-70 factor, ECF subfamily